jgi:CRISPR-associated endoribonuclease Cas6
MLPPTWVISPATVYYREKGKRKFPSYRSERFSEVIVDRLLRRHEALHDTKIDRSNFNLKIRILEGEKHLVTVKNTKYRAYDLTIEMEGKEELVRFAYEAGIGKKNSLGFGMLEIQ